MILVSEFLSNPSNWDEFLPEMTCASYSYTPVEP